MLLKTQNILFLLHIALLAAFLAGCEATVVTTPAETSNSTSTQEATSASCHSETASAPALAGDVLSGKEFWSGSGAKITGTMTNRGALDVTANFPGAGYYSGSVSGTPAASAICSGTTVLGVSGAATCGAGVILTPGAAVVAVNNTVSFAASNGTAPYTFSKLSGEGNVDSSGLFTAAATADPAVIRVTDNLGNTRDAAIIVKAGMSLSPTTITVTVSSTQSFTVTGGVPPYTFSLDSGGGSIDSDGLYSAPATATVAVVRVRDNYGNELTATATVSTTHMITLSGSYRRWTDGTYAVSCNAYLNPPALYTYMGDTGDGTYRIDPDGAGGNAPFDVYCDMTANGGGWTLVAVGATLNTIDMSPGNAVFGAVTDPAQGSPGRLALVTWNAIGGITRWKYGATTVYYSKHGTAAITPDGWQTASNEPIPSCSVDLTNWSPGRFWHVADCYEIGGVGMYWNNDGVGGGGGTDYILNRAGGTAWVR